MWFVTFILDENDLIGASMVAAIGGTKVNGYEYDLPDVPFYRIGEAIAALHEANRSQFKMGWLGSRQSGSGSPHSQSHCTPSA